MVNFGDILIYVVSFFGLYTAILCFVTLIETKGKREIKRWNSWPSICICVPCFNERKRVGRTLDSLLSLNYPKDKLEIIAVDDGSTDNTWDILKQYKSKGIKIFKKKNGGKHTALNLALTKTSAEFFGALDADSLAAQNTIKKIMSHFTSKKVMAVTPSMKIQTPKGVWRRVQSIEFILGILMREFFTFLGSQHVTPGPLTIFRKRFFTKYGNYRKAHLTEDIEMALRIQSHNFIIENAKDAYVLTHGPQTFKSLYKQRLRWYHGFLSNILDYKRLLNPKKHGNLGLFILPSSFLSIILVITSMFYVLFRMGNSIWRYTENMIAVNFDIFRMFSFNFDTFFINTQPTMLLSWLGLCIGIGLFLVAKHMSGEKQSYKLSYVWFFLLYWLLFGFWWLAAATHKTFKRKVLWVCKEN